MLYDGIFEIDEDIMNVFGKGFVKIFCRTNLFRLMNYKNYITKETFPGHIHIKHSSGMLKLVLENITRGTIIPI